MRAACLVATLTLAACSSEAFPTPPAAEARPPWAGWGKDRWESGDTLAAPDTTTPPAPWTCPDPEILADVHVCPGEDLKALVNAAPAGSRIYLHPDSTGTHTYEIGVAWLTLPSGASIRGPAAERFPSGEVVAPVAIRGAGTRIFSQAGTVGWTIEHLDISGARWAADNNQDGVCINRGEGTLRYVKVHDCDNKGLGAVAGLIEFVELTNNSARRIAGYSAASKSIYPHTIRHAYVHGNHFHGLWTDCDNAGWVVSDSRIVDNFGTGIFNEISRGPSYLARNVVRRNNQGGAAGRGGLIITSSKHVFVDGGSYTDNGVRDLRVWEDHRADNGTLGCQTGYRIEDVTLSGVDFGVAAGLGLPGVTVLGG